MNLQTASRFAEELWWAARLRLAMLQRASRHPDAYLRRVTGLHRLLRVPRDYRTRGLPFHRHADELVEVPCALAGVMHRMTPATRARWLALRDAAARDGIDIRVSFAFRSIDEQARMLRFQLATSGQSIDALLGWIAAPGYSEHHTGRALDLAAESGQPISEESREFAWLTQHADRFGFTMSYPRDNRFGILFEPWHWCSRAEPD